MLKNKYLIYFLFATSGLLLGVFFCNYSYFQFEKTIKISDLLSLLVTSTLGIYIATNVSRVFTKNNSEKELLIGEVKATLTIVNLLLSQINDRSFPFKKTVSNFKSMNESLILIEKLILSSHCKDIKVDESRSKLIDARKLITKISPINDLIILDSSNFNAANTAMVRFKTSLYDLIFEINKK